MSDLAERYATMAMAEMHARLQAEADLAEAVRLLEEAHRALSWSPCGPDRDLAARIQPFLQKHRSTT